MPQHLGIPQGRPFQKPTYGYSRALGRMPGMAASGMATAASLGTRSQADSMRGLSGCQEVLCPGL